VAQDGEYQEGARSPAAQCPSDNVQWRADSDRRVGEEAERGRGQEASEAESARAQGNRRRPERGRGR